MALGARRPAAQMCASMCASMCALLTLGWANVEVAFLSLPPVRTTEHGPVELRLAVSHDEPVEQAYQVTFLLDGEELGAESIVVAPGAATLATHWHEPAGPPGDHTLGYVLRQGPLRIAAGDLPFTILPSDQPGPRFFQAGWIDPGALVPGLYPALGVPGATDLRAKLAAMDAVGMDMVVVTYVEGALFGWGPFYPSAIPELGAPALPFDVVGTILDEADARGMHVFLGLGRGPAPLTFFPPDLPAIADAVTLGTQVADELVALYGHHESLYGWYLTHEMNFLEGASLYYDAMGLALDAHGSERPLLVSPSGTPLVTPTQIAQSEVDVFAYQDAVGAGYVPYVYTFDPWQRIAALDDVFGAYAALHAGTQKHLWANTECWEMAGPLYAEAYPASWPRLRSQLQIERQHAPVLSTYEFAGFMESEHSPLQLGGPGAVALYTDYRAWLVFGPVMPAPKRTLGKKPPPP
jgi:hypothetical protein